MDEMKRFATREDVGPWGRQREWFWPGRKAIGIGMVRAVVAPDFTLNKGYRNITSGSVNGKPDDADTLAAMLVEAAAWLREAVPPTRAEVEAADAKRQAAA
jgi:hypothetical protein